MSLHRNAYGAALWLIAITPLITRGDEGWPSYLHDDRRSGMTQESLVLPLELLWEYHTRQPPSPAWPPPARHDFWHNQFDLPARVIFDRACQPVSDGRVVVLGSSSDDRVYALDLATGQERWSFCTEGPVRLAPRLHRGNVYVTSDDGRLYCLNLSNGSLNWTFDPAPSALRIPGNGRLISSQPARTGVLIEDGVVRMAAGLFPGQGTYQYAVDAGNGQLLAKSTIDFSPQGYMQRTDEGITVQRGRAPTALLTTLQRRGTSDSTTLGKSPLADTVALVGAADLRIAGSFDQVVAFHHDSDQIRWSAQVPGRAYGLAIVRGCLLVSTDQGVISCFRGQSSDLRPAADGPQVIRHQQQSYKNALPEQAQHATALAQHLVDRVRLRNGYALLLGGADDAGLAYELARRTEAQVVVAHSDRPTIDQWRQRLHPTRLGGRVSVHHVPPRALPYAENLFDLIVLSADRPEELVPASSLVRRLTPGRGWLVVIDRSAEQPDRSSWRQSVQQWLRDGDPAITQRSTEDPWVAARRGPLRDTGEWTHMYADSANTSCSGDLTVHGPLRLQWFGQPGPREMVDRHHRTVPPLYCDGRLFVPADNRVIAVNAYNGTILWDQPVPGMRRVAAMRDAGNMVAASDRLYVVSGSQCLALDSETGQMRQQLVVPTDQQQARDWGYVARVDDLLYGSATKPGASRSGHRREQIYETYFDHVPIVTSDRLFCLDRVSGELKWQYTPADGAVLNPTITIGGDRVYFFESTNPRTLVEPSGRARLREFLGQSVRLVALDRRTGETLWNRPCDLSKIEHHLYLVYASERLIAVGTRNSTASGRATVWYDTICLDATTGKQLWSVEQDQGQGTGGDHGEQDHHPVVVGQRVFVEPYAYDLTTGHRDARWRLSRGGHGCGTLSASAQACFFRAGNPATCDLQTASVSRITEVSRPGCWINIIPAGGLLLIPDASSGCTCNFSIQASMAFAPQAEPAER